MNYQRRKEELLLASISFCIASIAFAFLWYHDSHSFIYFGDAVSHIVRARQFIDSQQPGIGNIGTVWLPLPHLLLIPFVFFDVLFFSGVAGAMLGIPLLVGIGLLLFSIIRHITNSRPIAFLIALLFSLNPNLIYIALTPMSEITLLFFVTLSGYALLKWLRSQNVKWFLVCSVSVMCATLCRYEAWLLAPFVSAVALRHGYVQWKSGNRNTALTLVLIQKISWLGILFWFCWNYFQYGDALKFAHWTYSVGTSAVRSTLNDHPLHLVSIILNALMLIFGPMIIIGGALVLFSMKRLSAQKEQMLLLLFFSLPAFFILSAILIGFIQVDQWWWNWRFVLSFGLFLSVASALGLQELFQKVHSRSIRTVIVICFCVVPIVQITIPSGVAIYNDAAKSFDERSRTAASLGEILHKRYNGGSVALLTGYGVGQRIMISSRLPVKTFNVKYFPVDSIFTISDRYIILGMDRTPESAEFSEYWLLNKELLLRHNTLISEDNFFVFLERK